MLGAGKGRRRDATDLLDFEHSVVFVADRVHEPLHLGVQVDVSAPLRQALLPVGL